MLVHLRVSLALDGAGHAGFRTDRHQRIDEVAIGLLLARQDTGGRPADVRAIEVQADAAGETLGILLAGARVRAGDACLDTIETGLDARREAIGVEDRGLRVRSRHLSDGVHDAKGCKQGAVRP